MRAAGAASAACFRPSANDTAVSADLAEAIAYDENARRRLRNAKAWVFDMDGVLYVGAQRLPGVNDLLNALQLRELPYMLATNNSMATAADYVKKLAGMGIETPAPTVCSKAPCWAKTDSVTLGIRSR